MIAHAQNPSKLWTLDRVKKAWDPVSVNGEPLGRYLVVYGFDGDQLVTVTEAPNRGLTITHFAVGTR